MKHRIPIRSQEGYTVSKVTKWCGVPLDCGVLELWWKQYLASKSCLFLVKHQTLPILDMQPNSLFGSPSTRNASPSEFSSWSMAPLPCQCQIVLSQWFAAFVVCQRLKTKCSPIVVVISHLSSQVRRERQRRRGSRSHQPLQLFDQQKWWMGWWYS